MLKRGRKRTTPVLVDCDTGIDDALALAYLLARPDVELVGVSTVFGNTSASQAARNTLDLLALAGREDIPVAVGAYHPLRGRFDGGAPQVHGRNGFGDVQLPRSAAEPAGISGPELIVRTAREHPGRLRVLAIGPTTNLALALELEPELGSLLSWVTVLGGTAQVSNNGAPAATNFSRDPHAAVAVLAACWVQLVTMDVTMRHRLEESHRHRLLNDGGPLARAVGAALDCYFASYRPRLGRRCSPIHDPLAAWIGSRLLGNPPDLVGFHAPVRRIEVELDPGPDRGRLAYQLGGERVGTPSRPSWHIELVEQVPRELVEHLVSYALRV